VLDFKTLEPNIDPNNRITFLLDWELTMKCNLDCSYCESGIYGGHDNSTQHPPLSECINTIDFMFEYADLYMDTKPNGIKYVVLNIYGGESLHHPDIVEILQRCRDVYEKKYKEKWNLTITTTTNAIISLKKLSNILPLIDEFTTSYHAENTKKQKDQFRENLLTIKNTGKRLKCVILIHNDTSLFNDSLEFEKWCIDNGIKNLPRQLDQQIFNRSRFNYKKEQVIWFDKLYKKQSYKSENQFDFIKVNDEYDLSASGRGCCGGRQFIVDQDYKKRHGFVRNSFQDWYCSVDEFFLYIKQITGEVFTNKDCKMNFSGKVGPIGNLNDSQSIINETKNNLYSQSRKVIQCKKQRCFCGMCAPKARDMQDFNQIIRKYRK